MSYILITLNFELSFLFVILILFFYLFLSYIMYIYFGDPSHHVPRVCWYRPFISSPFSPFPVLLSLSVSSFKIISSFPLFPLLCFVFFSLIFLFTREVACVCLSVCLFVCLFICIGLLCCTPIYYV